MTEQIKISLPDIEADVAAQISAAIIAAAPKDSVTVSTFADMPADVDEWIARTRDAHGIILGWSLPDAALAAAENLKAISFLGTGIADQVSLPMCAERGISAYNVTGYGDNAVAEHTIALLFAAWNQVAKLNKQVHAGVWNDTPRHELKGSTLGIIGYGGIGKRVAEIASVLGMNVKVWSRSLTEGTALEHGTATSLDDVLASSDAISLHLALNPATMNFIDEAAIAKMKDGVVFVNTARGDIVDTAALAAALQNGKIAAAGVDVFSSEPVAKDNPLLGLENAVLTPHVGYNTSNAVQKLYDLGTQNIVRHFWSN